MNPRPIIPADLAYWSDYEPRPVTYAPRPVTYAADDPNSIPCPGVLTIDPTRDALVVRVAWQLDEIELMHLAKGGTLWLSTWGGLPPHQLEVQEPT